MADRKETSIWHKSLPSGTTVLQRRYSSRRQHLSVMASTPTHARPNGSDFEAWREDLREEAGVEWRKI